MDWRLTNQKKYLYRATLKKRLFKPSENNDHEHCSFCWSKFGSGSDNLKEGYCTVDEYHWICDDCFKDFLEQFEWTIIEETKG